MILITHIVIALSSLLCATVAFFSPSVLKLRTSSTLVALTLASGTYLVISVHAKIVSACLSGLMYLAGVSVIIFAARRKLASTPAKNI